MRLSEFLFRWEEIKIFKKELGDGDFGLRGFGLGVSGEF